LRAKKYALWKRDPYHASLQFEERRNGVCVVRIGDRYRAVGLREGDVIAWFWIGTHEETASDFSSGDNPSQWNL
jgi:hypothetical protein